jgi:redox-sensitive bicupin YhaK (pirin superfamily)
MMVSSIQQSVREIVHRTRGVRGGPITRLMSPSDLGELVKPFVFLDLFDFDGQEASMSMEHGWHPHSGIATVTVVFDGAIRYAETTGSSGVLPAGSVEWMRAGNGVWHTGAPEPEHVKGFQLWVALPPELENAPNASRYVMPEDVPVEGPARVIVGAYGRAQGLLGSLVATMLDSDESREQPSSTSGPVMAVDNRRAKSCDRMARHPDMRSRRTGRDYA